MRWRDRLTWVRLGLSGLTTRGRSFAAAGAAAALCALVLGQRDLLRIAVLLLALPFGCAAVLARSRFQIALTRTVDPPRVVAGTAARVRLELKNVTHLRTQVLLAEDHLPYTLGAPPRFVLARLPAGQRAAVTYSVTSPVRGRYPIGPLRLRIADPFGMCEVTRSFTGTDPLVVVPRIWPLGPVDAGGLWAGTGESQARNAAASGEDDIATREYRHGDDLRRVHWRSTAKRGELMVRRDEQPRQMRATILLDTRVEGHRGEGPASSFEWAVSAAASVAVALAGQRYGVRLLVDDRPDGWTAPHQADGGGQLLDRCALIEAGGARNLPGAVDALARTGGDGLVVAVLGEIDTGVATSLARLGRRGARGVALLLRTTSWESLPGLRRTELDDERTHAATVLASGGWSVAECSPGETPADAWARALRSRRGGQISFTSPAGPPPGGGTPVPAGGGGTR
ncbi:MAG: hypothetical protein QG622_2515 [Actinomycetota bacterium]|nr:hypothetical protein [Actinomycetota bacterium]